MTFETQQGGHCGLSVQLVQTTRCSDLKTGSTSHHDDSVTKLHQARVSEYRPLGLLLIGIL